MAATTAGEGVKAMLGRGSWRTVRWLAAAGLACVPAILVSPYGGGLLLYPLRVVSIEVLQERILEWQSPNFHNSAAQVMIGLWLATAAAVGFSRRTLDLTDLLLVGCGLYLALLAGRNVALFALIAPPVFARHAQAALDDLRGRYPRLLERLEGEVPAPARFAPAINGLLLALVCAAALLKMALPLSPALNDVEAQRGLPVAAVDFIAAAQPKGPLFNTYNWGGYLTWRLYPRYLVFIDGRTDVYTPAFYREYFRVSAGLPGWEAILARYGVRLMLLEAGSPLAGQARLAAGWQQIYADGVAEVYERRP